MTEPVQWHDFEFAFEKAFLRVRVSGALPSEALDRIFPDYRVPPTQPGRGATRMRQFDFELAPVPTDPTSDSSWLLREQGLLSGEYGPATLPLAFGRLERQLADRLALGSRPDLLLHAAGTVLGGRGVLFAGPSGAGKSSIAAALAVAGKQMLGDDAVIINSKGVARPFRRLFKVHEGARAQLGVAPQDSALERLYPCSYFFHPDELGGKWGEPARVDAVVFLTRGTPSPISTLSASRGVRRLLDLSLGPDDRTTALHGIVSATAGAEFFELAFDRCDRAAADLIRAFGAA